MTETAKTPRLTGLALTASLAALAALVALGDLPALAGPTGGTVTDGTATIVSSGGKTSVTQTTGTATIEWYDFSVDAGESVVFDQPNANSIAINRVTGPAISVIDGTVSATGQVWILNSNGLIIGSNGAVTTGGGFLATTANLTDSDIGELVPSNGGAGLIELDLFTDPNGAIRNFGVISVDGDGTIVIAAAVVENSGTVKTENGDIFLGSIDELYIDLDGDELDVYAMSGIGEDLTSDGVIASAGGRDITLAGTAAGYIEVDIVSTGGAVEAETIVFDDGDVVLIEGNGNGFAVGGDASVMTRSEVRDEAADLLDDEQIVEDEAEESDAALGGCAPAASVLSGSGGSTDCLALIWVNDPVFTEEPFTNRGADEDWY